MSRAIKSLFSFPIHCTSFLFILGFTTISAASEFASNLTPRAPAVIAETFGVHSQNLMKALQKGGERKGDYSFRLIQSVRTQRRENRLGRPVWDEGDNQTEHSFASGLWKSEKGS